MTNELHLDEFRILDVKKDEDGSMLYLVEPNNEETECGRITLRLKEQVKKEVLNSTFSAVAIMYGISVTCAKKIFGEYVEDEKKRWIKYSPEVLGIDEAHLCNHMRGVFVDVLNRGLIEMLPGRDKSTVTEFLKSLPEHHKIKVVTMDMWRPYRDAVHDILPASLIVIDKFHVIKEVNNSLEAFRKDFQKSLSKQRRISLKNSRWLMLHNAEDLDERQKRKLEQLFSVYPELSVPYHLKESFRDIYRSGDRYIAEEKFKIWCESIPDELSTFHAVEATVRNWHEEIFNYFDYPYTNAVTESINNLIKTIEKAGRGYTFDIIRAKMLYGTRAKQKPVYKAKPIWNTMMYMTNFVYSDGQELIRGNLVDINQLTEVVNAES